MTTHDIAVIGGGCIGCSIAKHLREQSELDVCVLEKEHHLALHQSGRNSGVLHPGFNYEPGTLKARFSTEGTDRLKAYAREHDIALDECGVLVVARSEQDQERLAELQDQATANGVQTELLTDRDRIAAHEPHAVGDAALYCPEAASIDSQGYVYALAADAARRGVEFYRGYEVTDVQPTAGGMALETDTGTITASYVVNAAGLYADRIAHELDVGREYRIVPFRGEYYELVPEKRSLVRSMIYPTPDPELPFLGVHFTRRTDGKVIVGPNAVLAFGREAYRNTEFDLRELASTLGYPGFWRLLANPTMLRVASDELAKSYRKRRFVEAARSLVPAAESDDFRRTYAGNRAQVVSRDGTLVTDPLVCHGPRSTHVLNAVSPGLTSSLPFGEHVAEAVHSRLGGT